MVRSRLGILHEEYLYGLCVMGYSMCDMWFRLLYLVFLGGGEAGSIYSPRHLHQVGQEIKEHRGGSSVSSKSMGNTKT